LRRIAHGIAGAIEFAEFGNQARALTAQLLGAFGRAPDGGILQLAADLF
jgi:hypothetical protein